MNKVASTVRQLTKIKGLKNKGRMTTLLLTINSGKSYRSSAFVDACDLISEHMKKFILLKAVDPGAKLKGVDVQYVYETGERFKKFHYHGKIEVFFDSKEGYANLDKDAIQESLLMILGYKPYVNISPMKKQDYSKLYILG